MYRSINFYFIILYDEISLSFLYIYIDLQRIINVLYFKHQIINLEINKFDSCTTIINSINYDLIIIIINFYSLIYLLTF